MLSIKKCSDVLNKKEQKYNDEKIKAIRDYLYNMAVIVELVFSLDIWKHYYTSNKWNYEQK